MDYRDLPYDAEVEYLQSTGTQYINTGKTFKSNIRVVFSVIYTQTVTQYTQTWGLNRSGYEVLWGGNQFYFGRGYSTYSNPVKDTEYECDYDFTAGSMVAKINNTVVRRTSGTQPNASEAMYIFAMKDKNAITNYKAKHSKFKLYENGVIALDLIPVRVGNVGYMYDRVSGQLFGNAGTGNFILGPDVAPGRYANEIAFLESTGSQYIDLGVKANQDSVFELEFMATPRPEGQGVRVFGAREAWNQNAFAMTSKDATDMTPSFTYDNVNVTTDTFFPTINLDDGHWHTVKSNGQGHLQVDDVSKTVTFSNFTTPYNILLFGFNNGGTILGGCIKIRRVVLNNMQLIPVEYNNIGYMYDKVSGEFFANQGTGKFVLGHRAPRFDGKACARSYTRRQLMADTVLPKPYISDGLVFHLDGADATNTTWTDRVAGIVYTLQGASADGKGVTFSSGNNNTGRGFGNKTLTIINPNVGTIEVCAWRRSSRGSSWAEILYTTSGIPSIHYVVAKNGTYVGISNRNIAPAPRMPISGKTLGKFTHSCNAARSCYNGTMVEVGINTYDTIQVNYIAGNGATNNFKGTIYQIRIYNRQLSEAEMKYNQEQDRKRYGIQF